MQEITIALGTTLKEWRRINKKSQNDVARMIGFDTTQSQITKFERGLPVKEDVEYQISKFVQNRCLNEQRSDAINSKKEVETIKITPFDTTIDATISGIISGNTRTSYERIVEWLYLHDRGFDTKIDWRKAFTTFLKEIL